MKVRAALVTLVLSSTGLIAGPVTSVPYHDLLAELTELVDFERLPQRTEPGFNLDMPLYSHGAWLGERFEGQRVRAGRAGHDRIDGAPSGNWLRIAAGPRRQNLSIAFHRGFGSNAVFPLGTKGFPELAARGEGALAILFDTDQRELGFRVHAEYPDPLGARPTTESGLEILFFARNGRLIARQHHRPGPGITSLGYRRAPLRQDIAGVLILNNDPGGIAVDDIIFAMPRLLG